MSACENLQVDTDKFFKICESKDKKILCEVQYDLFQTREESEVEKLVRVVDEIRISTTKVRKGTYSAIGELKKRVIELEDTLGLLVRNICSK